jgi:hypothetical protein
VHEPRIGRAGPARSVEDLSAERLGIDPRMRPRSARRSAVDVAGRLLGADRQTITGA